MKLFQIQRIRAAALYGEFHAPGQIEIVPDDAQQALHLRGGEGRGGAAADVEGADGSPGLRQKSARDRNFLFQRPQIGLQQFRFPADGAADEAAIGAAGGAERNADVQRQIAGLQHIHRPDCGDRAVDGQPAAVIGDVIHVPQQLVRRFGRAAFQQMLGSDFRGSDAGQCAPWGRNGQQLFRGQIIALLQRPAAQSDGFVRRLDPPGGCGGHAVHGDFRDGGKPDLSPVEGRNRLPFRVVGKQGQL